MTIDEKLAHLRFLRTEVTRLEAEVWAEEEADEYKKRGLPTEPGWYIDANDNPAHLSEEGHWDDGWGNGGSEYGYPQPPVRRLVEES